MVTNTFGLVFVSFSVITTLNDSDCRLNEFVVTVLDDNCRRSCFFQGSVLLAALHLLGFCFTLMMDVAHTVSKTAFRKAFVGPINVHPFVIKLQE